MAQLDFGDVYVRRLPIYILIDCSESMVGEPLEAVNNGLLQLSNDLHNSPQAAETAYISIITFSSRALQITPLTESLSFVPPVLSVGPGTSLGAAFNLLNGRIQAEVRRGSNSQKGDWKPIVFLLTDGIPTDKWQEGVNHFKTSVPQANIIAIGCGEDADKAVLSTITPNVLMMQAASPIAFGAFFKWVSASISTASVSAERGVQGLNLPAPPAEIFASAPGTPVLPTNPSQIILLAHCRDTKRGYLMRYRRIGASGDSYQADKSYSVGTDYLNEAASAPGGMPLDSSKLKGAPACPYCHRPGWALAKDGLSLECSDRLELGSNQAQVMFVLDITGSMSGEIDGVKNTIKDFIDFIGSEGLSVEVGLIAFRDLEQREPPQVLKFSGRPFTTDAADFKAQVSLLKANGGGNNPGESSFDALALACEQPFAEDRSRILILITDEPPLIPDGPRIRSKDDLTNALRRAHIDQLHLIIADNLTSYYEPLHTHVKAKPSRWRGGGGAVSPSNSCC